MTGSESSYVGSRLGRREDGPLLAGRAQFVADITLPGMVEAVFVRSPVAHARITGIDLDGVRTEPAVLAVVTASDLDDVARYPHLVPWMKDVDSFPLARDRVRYVGMPVVAVLADDRYVAEDAAGRVVVDYDELPVVVTVEEALADDAPRLYDNWPDNKLMDLPVTEPEVDKVFAELDVVRTTFRMQRQSPSPMETRGIVADYQNGRLTVWASAQSPHILRSTLAMMLGLREASIRVIVPNVGGGFGCKLHQYTEDIVVPWLAMRSGRPVRWIEDRAEHLMTSIHAREQRMDVEAAYDSEGRIRAVRGTIATNVGSGEIFIPGTSTTLVSGGCLTGPYDIPVTEVSVACVVTNKTPSGAYRGFGSPEAAFAMERTVEKVARLAGVDPRDSRRAMLPAVGDDSFVTPSGGRLGAGSHRQAFDRVVELGDKVWEAARDAHADDARVRIGIGFASFVEPTGPSYYGTTAHWRSYDSALVRIEPDGSALVGIGVQAIGQGIQSTTAAIAADALGLDLEDISVVTGDTDLCPYGLGAWGGRGAIVSSGSVLKAAALVVDKAKAIAAGLLEADQEDIVITRGRLHVRGSDEPSVSMRDVATAAYARTDQLPDGVDAGLEATVTYEPPGIDTEPDENGRMNVAAAWSNASHAAIVKVDITTGTVEVLDYIVVHDCGTVINPLIVEGQTTGGVAQGIAGALYEHLVYDENGQPLSASFMDYTVPSSLEIPPITIEHLETPSATTALGVKGVGESGTIGPAAAIANAVADALAEFDVDIVETPITATSVLQAIHASDAAT
jgi:carbon-monoxide dehydrogenase large subunit